VQGDLAQLAVWLVAGGVAMACVVLAVRARRRRQVARSSGDGPSTALAREPPRSIRDGLAATRRRLGDRLGALLRGGGEQAAVLAEIEEVLIGADVGVQASARLVERVRTAAAGDARPEAVEAALRREIVQLFPRLPGLSVGVRPRVVLVAGVNGVGKTTTIGKLAAAAVGRGERVLLVAGDTYRAAAIEQLEAWGARLGVDVVRHAAGASPAAVAFDGVTAAQARDMDVVFVDTAGRLHTRAPLMDELRKVRRVVGQVCDGAPHETLLVLDATTGQNAIRQAKAFLEAVEVTGVVLTKLDGTAKGGVALAIVEELGIPIAYVGVGEGADDLRPFDPEEYADALLERPGSV
jgi:fused signal recognition particle receptor